MSGQPCMQCAEGNPNLSCIPPPTEPSTCAYTVVVSCPVATPQGQNSGLSHTVPLSANLKLLCKQRTQLLCTAAGHHPAMLTRRPVPRGVTSCPALVSGVAPHTHCHAVVQRLGSRHAVTLLSSIACSQALSTWHCFVQVLGMDLLKSGFFSVLPWITMAISANVSFVDTL